MQKVKLFFRQSWLLLTTALCFGLLISFTDAALRPRIMENQRGKINQKMKQLIAQAEQFKLIMDDVKLQLSGGSGIETDVYKAAENGQTVGFAYTASGSGFADKIRLIIAVDSNFDKFYGYGVLFSNETPNFGDKINKEYYQGQFRGAPAKSLKLIKTGDVSKIDDEIVAITGATVSSRAIVNIFNNYTNTIRKKLVNEGYISNGR